MFANANSFSLGGNGIARGAVISFKYVNKDTGQLGQSFTTGAAGKNCVVNEVATSTVVAPGSYRLTATYLAGNSRAYVVDEPVTDIVVAPSVKNLRLFFNDQRGDNITTTASRVDGYVFVAVVGYLDPRPV